MTSSQTASLTPRNPATAAWFFKTLLLISGGGALLAMAIGTAVFWKFSSGLPQIIGPADYRPLTVTRILGKGGREDALMGEFFKERRYVVPYEKIPDVVVKAFISAEDDRFFAHSGFNISSIIRASIANFKAGHVVQGGSTITQQVAKSLLLSSERSFVRKIKEVILSARIEKNLTKQQILFLYLNQIYLGHGAYGIQAASRTYFNKDIRDITIAEAALLAGMPQAPGKYSPLLSPKKAKERQLYVLRRMYENKYITQDQMTQAVSQALAIYHDEDVNLKYSPYLIEYIRQYLVEKYGEEAVFEKGLTVSIPSDPQIAQAAGRELKEGLREVDKRIGYRGPEKHLASSDEIEKFLKQERQRLLEEKVRHLTLLPNGSLDVAMSLQQENIRTEAALLSVGSLYDGVVTSFDPRRKSAGVLIGAVKAELPAEKAAWAKDRANGGQLSKMFKEGDVIRVKVLSNEESGVIVGLEENPQVQGALFSIEVRTGNVLAMEGGYDFVLSKFNRATQAQRQPGSSFKPIIYAEALERGYTPVSVLVDSPIVYQDADNGKWKPSNFEEKFYGDTTFRQALIKSRNVPTIKIVQSLGVPSVIDYAHRLGLDAKFNQDLSISLGSLSVSLMEMTQAYALFPRLGRKVTPIFIDKVVDRDGKVLEDASLSPPAPVTAPQPSAPPSSSPSAVSQVSVADTGPNSRSQVTFPAYPRPEDPDQVLDPRVAYVMTHLMKEVVTYGTGHEATNLGRPAAGKTGTTNDYVDAWFMGFTSHVVTGVWVGFDNQKSIGHLETGARAALPIWLGYMRDAVKAYPNQDFTIPPGVVFASIDPTSGKLAPANSSSAIKEAFIDGTQPTEAADPRHLTPDNRNEFFKEDTE